MIAGALYLWQGWGWIDPVMSLVIALVVVVSSWSLFRRCWNCLEWCPFTISMSGP